MEDRIWREYRDPCSASLNAEQPGIIDTGLFTKTTGLREKSLTVTRFLIAGRGFEATFQFGTLFDGEQG